MKRTELIQIKVTEKEKEKLTKIADEYNLSVSSYIRMKCLGNKLK